jgi:hypothetical protein
MATGLPVRFVALLVRFTVPPGRAQPDSRWHTSLTVCPVFLAGMPLAGGVFAADVAVPGEPQPLGAL